MNIRVSFVTSAASVAGFPREGIPEIALVGRSNVGKSSLINALVRGTPARTSAAPGKTRLANVYRVERGSRPPVHLVDLPGFGYARGGAEAAGEFAELTRDYFGGSRGIEPGRAEAGGAPIAVLLLVDARHPGLAADLRAWQWLAAMVERRSLVATKIDKLARGQRIRALRELESAFEDSVLPVSAVTGEGMDHLWRLIDNLANRQAPSPRSSLKDSRRSRPYPRATARHLPRK